MLVPHISTAESEQTPLSHRPDSWSSRMHPSKSSGTHMISAFMLPGQLQSPQAGNPLGCEPIESHVALTQAAHVKGVSALSPMTEAANMQNPTNAITRGKLFIVPLLGVLVVSLGFISTYSLLLRPAQIFDNLN